MHWFCTSMGVTRARLPCLNCTGLAVCVLPVLFHFPVDFAESACWPSAIDCRLGILLPPASPSNHQNGGRESPQFDGIWKEQFF